MPNQTDNTVGVLIGNGNGTFRAKTDFATGKDPGMVAAGDFNLDGKIDLATANDTSNSVSILLGNGSGGFAAKVDYAGGTYPAGPMAQYRESQGAARVEAIVGDRLVLTIAVVGGPPGSTYIPFAEQAGGIFCQLAVHCQSREPGRQGRLHTTTRVGVPNGAEHRTGGGPSVGQAPLRS